MKNLGKLLCVLVLATSCSSLSEKDCKSGDWAAIGKKDGERGYSEGRLESHQKACSEYGISIDANQYQSARKEGLKTYCTNTGMKHGKEAKQNATPGVCKGMSQYTTAYTTGFKDYCYNKGVEAGAAANKSVAPKACYKYRRFTAGWNDGLTRYCTAENGKALGESGKTHNSRVCPSKLKKVFLAAFDAGISTYCTKAKGFDFGKQGQDINPNVCPLKYRSQFSFGYKKGIEYKNIQSKISALNSEISELQTKAQDANTSADLRAYLQKEIGTKEGKKEELVKQTYRIEGAVGV